MTMRAIGLSLVLVAAPATVVAQEWSVDLCDVRLPRDDTRDLVRAESVRFLRDGKTIVTAGCFHSGSEKKAVGEIVLRNAADKTVTSILGEARKATHAGPARWPWRRRASERPPPAG